MKSRIKLLTLLSRRSQVLALAAAAMLGAAPAAVAEVTLINVFEVPEGALEEAIEGWEAARDFLSAEPGYISTALHQSLTDEARFRLVNVAVWESAEAFAAASRRMADQEVFPEIEALA
jgi:heme-degrading monooxygenase HmoA